MYNMVNFSMYAMVGRSQSRPNMVEFAMDGRYYYTQYVHIMMGTYSFNYNWYDYP